jgi:DNA mismatch endonuclease, patch repair protein
MADKLTREQRSANMRAVKSKNTAPEILARQAAHRLGLRFRIHGARLPGRPDIVFPKYQTVIFVHGCFWHSHTGCHRARLPKSNLAFWKQKIQGNRARDRRAVANLKKLGWRVVILWQCELANLDVALARLSKEMPRIRKKSARVIREVE